MNAPGFSRAAAALTSVLFFGHAATASAADAPAVQRGKTAFERSCAPCHGSAAGSDGRAMLPGTDALRLKYKGTLPALLEARTDLTADAIKIAVRRGAWSMPPFRKTELSDEDVANIVAYLATSPLAASR